MPKFPKIAVDVIIEKNGKVVLIKRRNQPFRGKWALPGGEVEYGEEVEKAAVREAKEETSLKVKLLDILGVYSDPKRDPREHKVAIVFVGKPLKGNLKGETDALEAKWFDLEKIKFRLAFDHSKILKDYIKWRRKKRTYWSTRK